MKPLPSAYLSASRLVFRLVSLAILAIIIILIALAVADRGREQRTIARILTARGEFLIRMLSGAHHADQRHPGSESRSKLFLDALMQESDIRFAAILDKNGQPKTMVPGESGISPASLASLPRHEKASWRLLRENSQIFFVVYRLERQPLWHGGPAKDRALQNKKGGPSALPKFQPADSLAVVGLDAQPYLDATRKDRLTLTLACFLGLASLGAALASLLWQRKVQTLEKEMARQEQLAALGALAGGVAHEIRNPLSSIKGFATYFKEKFTADSKDADLAGVMIGEVDRLDRVVSALLDLTRELKLARVKMRPSELFRHCLRLVEADCLTAHIAISSDFSGEKPLSLDQDRMTQVLLNLLLNAIAAMPEGGLLHVAAGHGRGRIFLRVSDTGCGIAPENLAHIFDPYFTTRANGTGLGLAVARKIAEAHGGHISAQSALGQGTVVTLEFPEEA